METSYARQLRDGEIQHAVLSAVCRVTKENEAWVKDQFPEGVSYYGSAEEMMALGILMQ